MFIRKRLNNPFGHKPYFTYQVCESYRIGNQVKQRVICSLGHCDNPKSALAKFSADLELYKKWLANEQEKRVYQSRQKAKEKRIAEYRKKIAALEKKLKKIRYIITKSLID